MKLTFTNTIAGETRTITVETDDWGVTHTGVIDMYRDLWHALFHQHPFPLDEELEQ